MTSRTVFTNQPNKESSRQFKAILMDKLDYMNPNTLHSVPERDRLVKVKGPIKVFEPSETDIVYHQSNTLTQSYGSGGKRMFEKNLFLESTLQ